MLEPSIAQAAIEDPSVRRLLTITGVNLIVAAGLVAAIGDVRRFSESAGSGFGDRLGVMIIVLLRLHIRADILGRHQT